MNIHQPVSTIYGKMFDTYSAIWLKQVAELRARFGGAVEEVRMPKEYPTDVPILFIRAESIVAVMDFMRTANGFEYGFLADITATDEELEPRFEIVYQLLSHSNMSRIRLKVRVRDGEEVPTITSLWVAANWPEREIYDMYGVRFSGHPNMRRILMDDRFVGHPLRKDYPLRGYQIFPDTPLPNPNLLERSVK